MRNKYNLAGRRLAPRSRREHWGHRKNESRFTKLQDERQLAES
jgi:hypothetical protein